MVITIDLPVKDEIEKRQMEKILYNIWKKMLGWKTELSSFLKMQEKSLENVWDDENLDVYNQFLEWKNLKSEK